MRLALLSIWFEVCFLQSFGVPLTNGRSSDVSSNSNYINPIRTDLFGSDEPEKKSSDNDDQHTSSNVHDSIRVGLFGSEETQTPSSGDDEIFAGFNSHGSTKPSDSIQSTNGDLCTTANQRAKYLNRLKMFNEFVKNTIQFLGEASSVVEENLDFEAGHLDNYLDIENIDCPNTRNITRELMYGDDEDVQYQGKQGSSESSNGVSCSLNFNKTLSFNITNGDMGPVAVKIDLDLRTLPLVQKENSNGLSVNNESEGNQDSIEENSYEDGITSNRIKDNSEDTLMISSRTNVPDSASVMVTPNTVHNNEISQEGPEIHTYDDQLYLRSFSGQMASAIAETSKNATEDTEDDILTTPIVSTLEDEITRIVPGSTEIPHTTTEDTSDYVVTTPYTYTTDGIMPEKITEHTTLQEIREENVAPEADNSNEQIILFMPDDNPNMEESKCKSTLPFVEDDWCIRNCAGGYCPPTYCKCEL